MPSFEEDDFDSEHEAETEEPSVEDDSDPFADLVTTKPSSAVSSSSSSSASPAPAPAKAHRTLEDTIPGVIAAASSAVVTGEILKPEDVTKFSAWLTSQAAEPPEGMRFLLSNFEQKVGSTLTLEVAERLYRLRKRALYVSKLEDKIFDPANLDRFDGLSPELIAFHERAQKAAIEDLKFVMLMMKDHPDLFRLNPQKDPNSQIATLIDSLRDLSPAQLTKLQDTVDSLDK